jgi:acyl-CoA thioester hydrolase
MTTDAGVDPWRYTVRIAVRQYELDVLGHVNNAVYLNWIEHVAIEHVEALGFGHDWSLAHGGTWVVREHHVTYRRPVAYGDVVLVTTLPQRWSGARGLRRTEIHREADGALMTEALTHWVWIRTGDGRPARAPAELLAIFAEGTRGPGR